ncbi:MAG: hypothetical protein AAFX02_02700 [Pseudomonadota bacterium]
MSQRFEVGDLESARKAGIIDAATAEKLGAFLRDKGDPGASVDNESLRFLANLNDVFLSIGLVILTFGLLAGSAMLIGPSGSMIMVFLPVIAALWGMMEYFAGRRRLLLPSMILALGITSLSAMLTAIVASGFGDLTNPQFNVVSEGIGAIKATGIWAAIGGLGSAFAVFARFRLPFSFFIMAGTAAALIYLTAATFVPDIGATLGSVIILGTGLATLYVACVFDMRDPTRSTLSSDNGFWLNFAAAPQIVFGLGLLLRSLDMPLDAMPGALIFMAALIPITLLSLALNRRALVAASLISFWAAISAIVEGTSGGNMFSSIVWAMLLTGGGVVLLSSGWKTARRMVLSVLPDQGSAARLFPPEPA